MNKKELEKLRTLNATKSMIDALKMPGKKKDWSKKVHEYKYWVAARCQQLDGILKVSICTREDIEKDILKPKWDIFINYEGESYITRERQEDGTYKWRTAMIGNLEEGYWYNRKYDTYMYFNAGGLYTIKELLKTKQAGSAGIMEWQQGCKRRREDKRINEQLDKWDEVMKPIGEPPKGFRDWYQHNGFDGSNFIYYKGAGVKTGYCTSCLKTVPLKIMPKHNMQGKCQVCHKLVTYISRARKRNDIRTRGKAFTYIQRYKDGLIQRRFVAGRRDVKDTKNVNECKFWEIETHRQIVRENEIKTYEYGEYKRRRTCWYAINIDFIPTDDTRIYTRNISSVFKTSKSSYPIAVKSGCSEDVGRYLVMEKKRPLIEMCMKAGLTELGKYILSDWAYKETQKNENAHELGKMLCIDKGRLKRLKDINGDGKILKWLQEEKRNNTIYQDEDIRTLCEADIYPEDTKRKNPFQYLSIHKVCNYLRKQQEYRRSLGRKENMHYLWSDWCDYVDMMKKMKMDCTLELLLKPKDLTVAHNELVARISLKDSAKEIKEKEEKFQNAKSLVESGELIKYEYSEGRYCIVAPKSIKDIYEEGIVLKHCIHTCDVYFQRMDIRETYLLFLRRAARPDVPWYTLEIEPGGNIRQKKSVLNEAYKDLDDALPFLRKWQQWVKKNLSVEDKKLAEKSNKARIKGYKQLREEKKLIWHGRLQGTLLVDALENDFMEVM